MTHKPRKRSKTQRSKQMRGVLKEVLVLAIVLGDLIHDRIKAHHDSRPSQVNVVVVPSGASPLVSQAADVAADPDGALKNPSLPFPRNPLSRLPGRDM